MEKSQIYKIVGGVVGLVLLIVMATSFSRLAESVTAGENVVCQDPLDGELHIYTAAGLYGQNFGECTHYKKSVQIWFTAEDVVGVSSESSPIKIRFNDGGHADIHGSVRADLPNDVESLTKIHTRYGSQEAVEHQLVFTVLSKAIYMTGPLMSSTQSYAERRNELIMYIEDQAANGVYDTDSREVEVKDPLSGEKKTISVTEIVKNTNGQPVRQEASPLSEVGIRMTNFSPTNIIYDDMVEGQIKQQQSARGQVETATANAKRAQQDAITAEQEGLAKYQTAKWGQEEKNAVEIAVAEKQKKVAELDVQTADLQKKADILRGEGTARARQLVMTADGALDKKLDAWVKSQETWASAFANYKGQVVPNTVMGGGNGNGNAATQFMELIGIKAARDLSLDMKIPKE